MPIKFFKFFFLLFTLSVWSQNDENIVNQLKHEDLKIDFQVYLNQEQKTLEFFQSQVLLNKDGSIDLTNEQNIAFYDQAVIEYKIFDKSKAKIYRYYDKKYEKDKELVFKHFQNTNKKLNELYITRIKFLKTKISNALKPEKADVLPSDVCQRLTESKELLQPTHDTCKNLGLSIEDETKCFANYLRKNMANHIQKYIPESEENIEISTMFQFVVDNEGNLIFDKFTRSSGSLEYDLVVYRGFKSFASTTLFCPAKHNDRNVAIFYNLPIRMVIGGY